MIELDNLFVIGAYLPPHGEEANSTSVALLDEWIAPLTGFQPVVLAGDFNREPPFAERWSALANRGCAWGVQDAMGTFLPTRWQGKRCVDWGWTSHPHMVHNVSFLDCSISDHKGIQCELRYNQEFVQSYRAVSTRSHLPPDSVTQTQWRAALEEAWQSVQVPEQSSTEQEWNEFCTSVENVFDDALRKCGQEPSRNRHLRCKGSHMVIRSIEASTFRIKQTSSCHELKVRKVLGRAREAAFCLNKGNAVCPVLLRKLWSHPLVRQQHFQNVYEIQKWAEEEYTRCVRHVQNTQLAQWRHDMRSNPKLAGKWVKKDGVLPVTSVFDTGFQHGAASRSNQESLQAICAFWSKIWERDKPLPEDAFQFWRQDNPEGESLAWANLTKEELHAQAAAQRDTAGGCDGFHGTEIANWPLHAWHIFAILLARWQARSELPSCWSQIKQVDLQKPDAKLRAADAAIAAKDMRPISIQSVLWRVTASAWAKRDSTRAWVRSRAHPTAFGGLHGRNVGQAVDALLQVFQSPEAILASLDYQKCFDCVDPAFGIKCLKHMGCPSQVLSMLQVIWNQKRWLTWNGEFLAQAVPVCSSMPQGDALSPLPLIAIISGLTTKAFHIEYPVSHSLATYLDDRNFVTKSATHAARLWCLWQDLSSRVGLLENQNKVRVIPRRANQKQQLLDSGFSEQHLATSARVLGVDINARLGGANRETQEARIQVAMKRVSRIGLLPVKVQHKAKLIASLAIPKAIWGSLAGIAPFEKHCNSCEKGCGWTPQEC